MYHSGGKSGNLSQVSHGLTGRDYGIYAGHPYPQAAAPWDPAPTLDLSGAWGTEPGLPQIPGAAVQALEPLDE
jgi:hypothetical protein